MSWNNDNSFARAIQSQIIAEHLSEECKRNGCKDVEELVNKQNDQLENSFRKFAENNNVGRAFFIKDDNVVCSADVSNVEYEPTEVSDVMQEIGNKFSMRIKIMKDEYLKVPHCDYVGYKDGKLWNTKKGKELRGRTATIRLSDGNRYCFTLGKLMYCAINGIHPLNVDRNIRIDSNGKAVDKYKFYSQLPKRRVSVLYQFDPEEYRKLLDCIEKNEVPTFIFDFYEEIKSYCAKYLRVSNEEAHELTMYALTDFIDKVSSKAFPKPLVGYLKGTAKRALALRRKSNKIFKELKNA